MCHPPNANSPAPTPVRKSRAVTPAWARAEPAKCSPTRPPRAKPRATIASTAISLPAVNAAWSRLQAAFTAGKLMAVLAIVALGFALGGRVGEHFAGSARAHAGVPARDFLTR